MSNKYIITCSSTCDLTKKYLSDHNIPYVHFNFMINDEKYIDDFYDNLNIEEFCKKIKTGNVKTSQPEPEQYINTWEAKLKEGYDIYHMEVSTGITGAYNSACIARDMLSDVYPDRKIEVVDTHCCSTAYGKLLMWAVEKKEAGASMEEVDEYVKSMQYRIHHIFIPNIEQLGKGGRIPAPVAAIAKIINIIPILDVSKDGHLRLAKKVRGMKAAINEMLKMSEKVIENGLDYTGELFSTHVNNLPLQTEVFNAFKDKYKKAKGTIEDNIYRVGSVIAAHCGEGTVSIFYVGSERE